MKMMERTMEDVIAQQISAAIDALSRAKARLSSEEVDMHLDTAASFINDIQFNILSLRAA
jgi:DNA-binding FrmR family transcriptional regulator